MICPATDGSVSHCLSLSWPSPVVAAWASSGMLWQMSLKIFLECSGISPLTEQYGSTAVLGSIRGSAANWVCTSCR